MISETNGTIIDIYTAAASRFKIVHIQDLHNHCDIQISIYNLINEMIDKQNLRLVAVEGLFGKIEESTTNKDLELTPLEKAIKNAANRLSLNIGQITGAKYAQLMRPGEFSLWGVDDPQLHAENAEAQMQAAARENENLLSCQELESILKQMKELIFSAELQEFEIKKSASRESVINLIDYYHFLLELLKSRGLSTNEFTIIKHAQNDFTKYHEHVTLIEIIVTKFIFETADQRLVYSLSQHLNIIKSLVTLKLTPEMYSYYQQNRKICDFTYIGNSILNLAIEYDLMAFPDLIFPEIEQNIHPAKNYYRLATERNAALVNNTLEVMKNNNINLAVLVAGGFHSEGIATLLKEQEISYIVVTPAYDLSA